MFVFVSGCVCCTILFVVRVVCCFFFRLLVCSFVCLCVFVFVCVRMCLCVSGSQCPCVTVRERVVFFSCDLTPPLLIFQVERILLCVDCTRLGTELRPRMSYTGGWDLGARSHFILCVLAAGVLPVSLCACEGASSLPHSCYCALSVVVFSQLESNARVVSWEDGTRSLFVGKECFDINEEVLRSDGQAESNEQVHLLNLLGPNVAVDEVGRAGDCAPSFLGDSDCTTQERHENDFVATPFALIPPLPFQWWLLNVF